MHRERGLRLLTVWAGQHHAVTVGVAKPALPVRRTSHLADRRVARRLGHLGAHLDCPGHTGIEVVDLEPQQNSVAVGLGVGSPIILWVMFNGPVVKLKDQAPIRDQTLVLHASVRTPTAE